MNASEPRTFVHLLRRIGLPLVGVVLTAGFIAQARAVQTGAKDGAQASAARIAAADPTGAAAGLPAGVGADRRIAAEGRLVAYPGADVVLAFDGAGTITRLPVQEKHVVRAGQVIAAQRADDLAAQRDEALSRASEAAADIALGEAEVARAEGLLERGTGTRQAADRARRDLEAARARHDSARAQAARIDAEIAKARLVSPIDGVVLERFVEPGENVDAGTPVLRVADLSRVRIEAEVNEYDAGRVKVGAPASIVCEGFPGRHWTGRVEEVPDAVVARSVRPEDPGRPVDTRVLLVKIALDEATPLKLGQRVEVAIAAEAGAGR